MLTSIAFSPDGSQVATTSVDFTVRIWPVEGDEKPIVLKGTKEPVLSAQFSPDGSRLAVGYADSAIRIWRTDGAGAPIELFGHEGGVSSVAFMDNTQIVSGSLDWTVRTWDFSGPKMQAALRAATSICLEANFRRQYMSEGADEAADNFAACEAAHGRAPTP